MTVAERGPARRDGRGRTGPRSFPRAHVALAAALASLAATAGPSEALAYTATAVADGGTLAGVLRFAGKPVASDSIPVSQRQDVCGDRKSLEPLVLGPDRGVVGGVVLVQGVTQGKPGRFDMVLDHRGCAFTPRVMVTMAGGRARVRNSDPIVHRTRGVQGRTTVFDVAIPGKEQEVDITRRLTRPGVVRVISETAPHTSAWVIVHDSPYLAVTDEHGAFRIEDIPPGAYRITVWHEGFRRRGTGPDGRPVYEAPHTITKDVMVTARGTATVAFELK